MTGRTVAATVADELAAAGVTTGFGVVGEGNLAVVYELVHRHGLAWVPARREDGGVAMADGYARRGNRLGFAAVTHGPALTNALTALIEARKAGSPLVVLTGEFPASGRWHPQWIPQPELLTSVGISTVAVTSADTAAEQTRAAIAHARDVRHPVVLSVRTDLFADHVDASTDWSAARQVTRAEPGVGEPDAADLDQATDLISAAQRPVVLAGHGVVRADAAGALTELADRAGALLGTTLRANGLFTADRWNLGMVGGFARPASERLVRDADLVVVVGAGLNQYTTDHGRAFGTADVIRLDASATPAEPACPVTLSVTGDARDVVAGLTDRLKPASGNGYRTPAVETALRAGHRSRVTSGSGRLDPESISILLDHQLPAERTVCTDLGYFTSEVAINVAVRSPNRFVFPVNFGSVGLGLATAIGAAHATDDTITLATLGDGGLAMSLQELETLARTQARVLVVVYNDAAYGVEYHVLRDQGREIDLAMFDDVDFAAVARSLGIPAVTARTPDEAAAAITSLSAKDGPALLNVKVDGTVRTRWYQNLPRKNEEDHA